MSTAQLPVGHAVHYLHGGHADGADLPKQVDDPLLVVGKAVVVELLPESRWFNLCIGSTMSPRVA